MKMDKENLKNKITCPKIRAFSVHLLTASGSFFAFLSLVAAADHYWTASFIWLGIALIVDGIDGPIARKIKVKEVLPNWSGELLDNVIDYVTYVLIPAFILHQSDLLHRNLSFLCGIVIVVSSAIYYADTGMKTKENFFKGFPVVWNMLIFSLFILQPSPLITLALIFISAFTSFLPINFLHPVRVERMRFINLPIFLLWCLFAAIALFYNLQAPLWVKWGFGLTGVYIYIIGGIMQMFPNLGKRSNN